MEFNKKLYRRLLQIFTKKDVAKGNLYTEKHFCQDGIPKTQVYHVFYQMATESVNHKKDVGTPQNLTKPQEDIILKREKQKTKIATTSTARQYDRFKTIDV